MIDSSLLRFLSQKNNHIGDNGTIRLDYVEMGDKSISQIAQRLMDLNSDEERAMQAATAVESMAVSRHARRQWRNYLKERQELFSAETNSSPAPVYRAYSMDDDLDNAQAIIVMMAGYGLTGRDIATILVHTPSIAFLNPRIDKNNPSLPSLEGNIEKSFVQLLMGRQTNPTDPNTPPGLRLRKYDARKVLRETQGLLTCKGSQNAVDMVIIMNRLGVSQNALARNKKGLTVLFRRSPTAVFRLISFLVSGSVRMPIQQVGPLIRRSSCHQLLEAVAPIPTDSFVDAPSRRFQRQLARTVVDDTYERMAKTSRTLMQLVGQDNLVRAVSAFPGLLLLDARRQILPMAGYLIRELQVGEYLPLVLQLYPSILRMDLDHLRTVVEYFRSLDISEQSLAVIVRSFPRLLTLDVEHDMEPVVEFLRKEVGIANVGRFITRLPPVLGYSIDTDLRPKYKLLQSFTAYPAFEISKFPAFFSYPMERTRLRFGFVRAVAPRASLSLDDVLRHGDTDFARLVGDDGRRFREYVDQQRGTAAAAPRRQAK